MSRTAYVNGRYVHHAMAAVHIEDRGYQFADGVYEVCEIMQGYLIDLEGHMQRLQRSLRELSLSWPVHDSALRVIMREVIRRNRIRDGMVYLQITRGVARRDHGFPPPGTRPSLVVTAKRANLPLMTAKAAKGIAVITVSENRWERVDIKTIGLLPNVLARQKALDKEAQEAWFVDADGMVTEGTSSNAWIVTGDGLLVTRPAVSGILRGITRERVFDVAARHGLKVEERGFSVEEAKRAREAFVTSATSIVMPVVLIDSIPVANGHPGTIAQSLREAFFDIAEKTQA